MRTPDYSEAEKLRRQLESPIFNPLLKKWVGKGELDYEVYIKTPTLLTPADADGGAACTTTSCCSRSPTRPRSCG